MEHILNLLIDNHIDETFYNEVRQIIISAKSNAVRSVEFERVLMYWKLGEKIFTEEQNGKERAKYGEFIIKNLSNRLEIEFGSGFSYRQLAYCRKFYRIYPIVNALRSQLNWFQYRQLISIDDEYKREYYELESVNNAWSGRETERQINSYYNMTFRILNVHSEQYQQN